VEENKIMKIYEWKEGMTAEESKDGGYWERNMLALLLGTTINKYLESANAPIDCGWYYDTDNNWDGWKRVIGLFGGTIAFHIPDDFDVGSLPQIEQNWDGHTTREKWERVMNICGCTIDPTNESP
jgi:hypothetical protein